MIMKCPHCGVEVDRKYYETRGVCADCGYELADNVEFVNRYARATAPTEKKVASGGGYKKTTTNDVKNTTVISRPVTSDSVKKRHAAKPKIVEQPIASAGYSKVTPAPSQKPQKEAFTKAVQEKPTPAIQPAKQKEPEYNLENDFELVEEILIEDEVDDTPDVAPIEEEANFFDNDETVKDEYAFSDKLNSSLQEEETAENDNEADSVENEIDLFATPESQPRMKTSQQEEELEPQKPLSFPEPAGRMPLSEPDSKNIVTDDNKDGGPGINVNSMGDWLKSRMQDYAETEKAKKAEILEFPGEPVESNKDGYYNDTPSYDKIKFDHIPKIFFIKLGATVAGMFLFIAFLVYYA